MEPAGKRPGTGGAPPLARTIGPRLFRYLFFHSPVPYRTVRRLAPALVGTRPAVRDIATFRMQLNVQDILQTRLLLDGVWEPPFTRWWAFFASTARCVFDVGAHCGYYTLFARSVAPDASIHAFEPNPVMRRDWVANMELNGVHDGVRLDARAVSDSDAPVSLHLRDIEPATASLQRLREYDRLVTADAVTLDSYRAEQGIDEVDLVKFDIEGAELQAIHGMREGITGLRYGCMMIETHKLLMGAAGNDLIRDLLLSAGYVLYRVAETTAVPLDADSEIPDYDQWIALTPDRDRAVDHLRDDGVLRLPAEFATIYEGVRWSPA